MMPKDKLYHLIAGAVIGLLAFFNTILALVVLVLAAVGKEVRDKYGWRVKKVWPSAPGWLTRPGTPEFEDIAATLTGGALVIFIIEAWRL